MRRLPLTIIALLTIACEPGATRKPFAKDVLGKLKDAVEDIDASSVAKGKLCGAYRAKGKVLAEAAWQNEWTKFAPLWDTPANPAADLKYCTGLIRDSGAIIVEKQSDSTAASAVCFQAQFPRDFGSRPIEIQAAITCHEAAHIEEQGRVGCGAWVATYLATISARLTYEGTAYALHAALLERYGWSRAKVDALMARKAAGFPERYSISRKIISDECTHAHWSAIRETLRERSGR